MLFRRTYPVLGRFAIARNFSTRGELVQSEVPLDIAKVAEQAAPRYE